MGELRADTHMCAENPFLHGCTYSALSAGEGASAAEELSASTEKAAAMARGSHRDQSQLQLKCPGAIP